MATAELLERNVTKSGILSKQQMPTVIPLVDVLRVLNRAKVTFVLVGAHGLASWRGKPRATEDVDVVVMSKHLKKAVKALIAAFPDLEPVDLPVVIRLRNRESQDVLIDVMKPVQQPYVEAFRNTYPLTIDGEAVRIPSVEMAIVMKFSAMTSLHRRDEDKFQDAHDFIYMVKNNPERNRQKMAELASLIYPDGGKDVLEMVRKIDAGEKLVL